MAPALPATTLARRQLAARFLAVQSRGYATPRGPPPQNFRTSRRVEWPWDKESTLDRLGKYFLLTEMARGMYVLMEQFFRAPYVASLPPTPLHGFPANIVPVSPSTTHLKR